MPLRIHYKHGSKNDRITHRQIWHRLLALILFPLMILAAKATASGLTMQSQLSIKEVARAFIIQQIDRNFPNHEIEVNNLDSRLKLAVCDMPLEGFLPLGSRLPGNTTIGIRCAGTKPWTVYISVSVKAKRMVVTANHPILRNATIAKSDIRLEERDVTTSADTYIYDPEHVLGKIAKRSIATSTVLTPDMLNAPLYVHRGQQVIIVAEDSGIQVRMSGTALMDGAEGQIIRAQNALSKRAVEGQVVQPGIIRVNM